MPTSLSHRKAWMEIAEVYATPRHKRTKQQTYIAFGGLCAAARRTKQPFNGISMLNALENRFWWPLISANDKHRAFCAMLIAHMGEKEFRMLREE